MKIDVRGWPFAWRRICGKSYTLALMVLVFIASLFAAIALDTPDLFLWTAAAILVVYGGGAVLASAIANRTRLNPHRPPLSQMRAGRTPVFAELRKYGWLIVLILSTPLIFVGYMSLIDWATRVVGPGQEVWVLILSPIVLGAFILVLMYRVFRWEAARAWQRDVRQKTPFALYLRSFAEDASVVVGPIASSRAARSAEHLLGRMFSVERLILRALLTNRLAGVAVGAPGERLPPLGFHRLYFSDQDWQREVADLIADCRVVIVNSSISRWVEWELAEIVRQGLRDKLILIAHGRTAGERVGKLNFALSALGHRMTLAEADAATIALARLDLPEPLQVLGYPDDLFAYLDATTACLHEIEGVGSGGDAA